MEKILFNIQDVYQTINENNNITTPLGITEERGRYMHSAVNAGMHSYGSIGKVLDFIAKDEIGLKNLNISETFFIGYLIGIAIGRGRNTKQIAEQGMESIRDELYVDVLAAEQFFKEHKLETTPPMKMALEAIRGKEIDENSNKNPFKRKEKGFDLPGINL
jgi:hypothetical protein